MLFAHAEKKETKPFTCYPQRDALLKSPDFIQMHDLKQHVLERRCKNLLVLTWPVLMRQVRLAHCQLCLST